jgi:hypothetical protein
MPTPMSRKCELKESSSGTWVEASVLRDITAKDITLAEKSWKPIRRKLAAARRAGGGHPEHAHWDWTGKTEPSWSGQWCFVAVKCGKSFEGLMAVRSKPRTRRTDAKPVLYVDFVEVAPWNSRNLTDTPRYSGVGSILIQEAVAVSLSWGWEGRVGLSSLPQAKGFYSQIGMRLVEKGDPDYGDLDYFEFDESDAKLFLVEPTTPVLDGRAWVGIGTYYGTAFIVELCESRKHPGYYHYATYCLDDSFQQESKKPFKADVLQTHIDLILKEHGLTTKDLDWSEESADELALLGVRARAGE